MDVLGLLAACFGVLVFPGGIFVAGTAIGTAIVGAVRPRLRGSAAPLAGLALLALAGALLPFPGSPTGSLPPSGERANAFAFVLLAGSGLALGGRRPWPWARWVPAIAASAAVLCLAAQAGSLDLGGLLTAPGPRAAVARDLAALTLVLAGPPMTAVGHTDDGPVPVAALGLFLLLAALLGAPGILLSAPGWLVAVVVLVVAAGAGGVLVRVQRHSGRVLPVGCVVASAAAAAVALSS